MGSQAAGGLEFSPGHRGLYVGAKALSAYARRRGASDLLLGLRHYLVEGAIFLLTGLQARVVLEGLAHRMEQLVLYALAQFCRMAVRYVRVFLATYVQRCMSQHCGRLDPRILAASIFHFVPRIAVLSRSCAPVFRW